MHALRLQGELRLNVLIRDVVDVQVRLVAGVCTYA